MSLRTLLGLLTIIALLPVAAASPFADLWEAAREEAQPALARMGADVSYEEGASREHASHDDARDEPAEPDEASSDAPRDPEGTDLLGVATLPLDLPPLDLPVDLGILPEVDASLALPDLAPQTRASHAAPAAIVPRPAPAAASSDAPAAAAVAAPPTAAIVAAAIVAAQPAFSFSWERFRRFGLFALLYTRIAKENLLDHERREALLHAIRTNPGSAVADLVRLTNVPRNTAVYHLTRLEREGLVSSEREGRTRLYFAPGALEKRGHAEALAALRHDTSRAIALEIGQTPGLDQNTLCQRFGLAPSLAHWHADRLERSGIVEKRREGRRVRYYPGSAFPLVSATVIHGVQKG